MKDMKNHPFLVITLLSVLSLLTAVAVIGCPAGTKTTVEAGIGATVDPQNCQEVKGDAGEIPGPNVLLNCVNVTGTGTISITLPRAAWWNIKLASSDAGKDAGPGK